MKYGFLLGTLALLGSLSAAWLSSARADVDPAVLEAEQNRIAAMDRAKDGVLAVFSPQGKGGGSGVVISPDGYALTNFHVVKPCGNAMKCGMADGKLYDAVIVGIDPTGDVALIKLLGRDDFPYAELGDSDRSKAGDWVFAMGNPFLLATDFQPTVTYGILSGVHRYQYPSGTLLEYADCLQTDASINPGNSGGPLFDAEGRLLGINGRGSFEKRGRVNVGVAYAISINQIKNFLGYLHSGRVVDHATLGATVASDEDGRVVVSDVLETSDAYRRGLRYDDEIVRFAGRPILTTNGFKNVLGIYPKGWRVGLSYRRDGKRVDTLVRLEGVHSSAELLRKAGGGRRAVPQPIPKPEKPEDQAPQPKTPAPGGDAPTPGDAPAPGDDPEKPSQPIPIRPGHPIPIRPGQPMPVGGAHAPPPMPAEVKKLFEAKSGFSNYYFNKLHRQRVLEAWTASGDLLGLDGPWTLSGKSEGGAKCTIRLTDADGRLTSPDAEHNWIAGDELGQSLQPRGSGGLLLTLHMWRRLAVLGYGKFGDVYYLGTMPLERGPLAGRDQMVDVLVGTHQAVVCHFLFDPETGHLLGVEMFPDDDVDPCEVYFSDYREVDGRFVPAGMEVRHGDLIYGKFQLDACTFEKADP